LTIPNHLDVELRVVEVEQELGGGGEEEAVELVEHEREREDDRRVGAHRQRRRERLGDAERQQLFVALRQRRVGDFQQQVVLQKHSARATPKTERQVTSRARSSSRWSTRLI
jgi:hypothetical protein